MLWPLWSEFLLSWARTRRYWFNTLANLGGSLLYFYAILLGFSRLTPEEGRFLDPGPLLLVFTAFNLTLFTFQSIAYTVQGEAQLGTLEHMALARGGLLRQLLLRALVQSLSGVLWSLLVLLPLALAFGVALGPLARWPLGFLPLFLAALGFGLLMGATALYFKQVDEFFTIVQFLFLPYFFYLVRFEPWMGHLPFAPGVHLLRLSLSGAEAPWDLLGLALFQGVLLFALGLWAMAYMYRLVRRRGILGGF